MKRIVLVISLIGASLICSAQKINSINSRNSKPGEQVNSINSKPGEQINSSKSLREQIAPPTINSVQNLSNENAINSINSINSINTFKDASINSGIESISSTSPKKND